jgi:DHA2 family multidrug resistance protein
LFGYDAYHSGLVLSPAGIAAIGVLLVVGALLGRGLDARWFIGMGLIVLGGASYWMSLTNLEISPWQVVWPRVVTIGGLSMIFAPLNVAAYLYTPRHLRGAAVGLLALLRNEGGSVGTSLAQTIQERREQFHTLRLGEYLDRFNPAVTNFAHQSQAALFHQTGDPALARRMSWQLLDDLRLQQASSLAYFDVFWVCAAMAACLVVLVLIMKRSVAEKGAAVGGE